MAIARQKKTAKELAQITNQMVEFLPKIDPKELNAIIYPPIPQKTLTWPEWAYSLLPWAKVNTSNEVNANHISKPNLELVLDYVKESNFDENSICDKLLREIVRQSSGSEKEKQLQHRDMITLRQFLFEKIKYELAQNAKIKTGERMTHEKIIKPVEAKKLNVHHTLITHNMFAKPIYPRAPKISKHNSKTPNIYATTEVKQPGFRR
jgi:hypothetical protein